MLNGISEIDLMKRKLEGVSLPPSVSERINTQLARLTRLSGKDYTLEVDSAVRWVDWLVSLPWDKRAKDQLDLTIARQILDDNHYGLDEDKERILEYLSVLKLRQGSSNKQQAKAPILLLVGLVGTGKTTLAYSIANAINKPV